MTPISGPSPKSGTGRSSDSPNSTTAMTRTTYASRTAAVARSGSIATGSFFALLPGTKPGTLPLMSTWALLVLPDLAECAFVEDPPPRIEGAATSAHRQMCASRTAA